MNGGPESAAAVYSAALREVLQPYRAGGGTQAALASSCYVSRAAMSRYLSGERLAERSFVARLREALADHGHPLTDAEYERLIELCGDAHRASGSPSVQLAQLREELAELKQAQVLGGERLAEVEEQAAGLFRELFQAREQAQAAEGRESELTDLVARQRDQLHHAQEYTRQLEAELTEQTEQAALLLQEVSVLRAQNAKLLDGTAPPVSFVDNSVDATLARRAARLRERATTEALAGPGDGALTPAKPFRPSAELLHKKRHPPGVPKPDEPTAPPAQDTAAWVIGRYVVLVAVPLAWIFIMMGVLGVAAAAGVANPGPHLFALIWAVPLCFLGMFLVVIIDYIPTPRATDRTISVLVVGCIPAMVSGAVVPFFWDPAFLFWPSHRIAQALGLL
ncbi:hypothetical protein OG571_44725 (plasmid) [Streptomyces sp. NBC_01369]|uniref:hypothetical protein n=1 Tax=unclassified Streptomyces TaxID=2593676 RepID=UPI0022517601|nr:MULTISPECIES: hypothetical protein [unclassified Streptomyces]MCX4870651.1 hypothetical protein [Streptomyces sp. NBC_00906]MCX4901872.1 hypothetical protein [Streptomyces sp. NBC_00892]